MKSAIIGIDQSYTDTGIAIAAGGKILAALSLPLNHDLDILKRKMLRVKLEKCIKTCRKNKFEPIIYIEAVRINKGQTTFDYIKRAGAMESAIFDVCYDLCVECRSVSSNSWKAKIVGSREKRENSKGIAPQKYMTYLYTSKIGLDKYTMQPCKTNRTKNYVYQDKQTEIKYKYNDNIGDACCISLYGCMPEESQVYNVLVEKRCDDV